MVELGIAAKELDYHRISKDVAKCGACGNGVVFDKTNKYYYCSGRKTGKCEQPYVKHDVLELDFKKLAAELQRITRKSTKIRELKSKLRKNRTQLVQQIKQYDRRLAKEAKNVLLVDKSKSLKSLRFEVAGIDETKRERTTLRKRLDATMELLHGIGGLKSLSTEYEVDPCPETLYFKRILIEDKRITEIELMPGMDYLVQLARSEIYYAGKAKIRQDETLLEMDFDDLLDKFGANMMQSCIYYEHQPSDRTRSRRYKRDEDMELETLGERLMQKVFMFATRFEPLKSAWDRAENPTEREQALDRAFSLDNAPPLYDKGGPLVITPKNAIKNLEHQIKWHEWLLKHQPSNPELYYRWEDQTRHMIGKIFGFKSEPYSGFIRKTDFLKLFRKHDLNRIVRFLDDVHEKRVYLETLICDLEASAGL